MGHNNSKERLNTIKENVRYITQRIRGGKLVFVEKYRYQELLIVYSQELKLILSKNLNKSKINKVEKLIAIALRELKESGDYYFYHHQELSKNDPDYKEKLKTGYIKTIEEIDESMTKIAHKLKPEFFKENKSLFDYEKMRFEHIRDIDEDIEFIKSKLLSKMAKIEPILMEMEADYQLNRIEEKHYQSRLDINKFIGVFGTDIYNEHKSHLLQLKQDATKVNCEMKQELQVRRNFILYNIENNISVLDYKARENQDKINQKLTDEIYTSMNQKLVNNVLISYTELEKASTTDCSVEEIQNVFDQLSNVKMRLDQRLRDLKNQIDYWKEEVEDEPELRHRQTVEDFVDGNLNSSQFAEDAYVQLKPAEQENIQNYSPKTIISTRQHLEDIQDNIKIIRDDIFNLKFNRESHIYMDYKLKLEGYRVELINMPAGSEENKAIREGLLQYANDVYDFLQNNTPSRNSTTGDFLIDIMSISTRVNALGERIENEDNSIQDYCAMENTLMDQLRYLRELEISPARSNICSFRDYVLIQIESHLSNLDRCKRKIVHARAANRGNNFVLSCS